MTPKEKAKELYVKAEDYIYTSNAHFADDDCEKNCAIMVVDEIIKATQRESINDSGTGIDIIPMKYWLDVKKEINLID